MEDEILHINPIRPYENDSLCEIEGEGDQKYFQTKSAISKKLSHNYMEILLIANGPKIKRGVLS